jgi:hypothetical protein
VMYSFPEVVWRSSKSMMPCSCSFCTSSTTFRSDSRTLDRALCAALQLPLQLQKLRVHLLPPLFAVSARCDVGAASPETRGRRKRERARAKGRRRCRFRRTTRSNCGAGRNAGWQVGPSGRRLRLRFFFFELRLRLRYCLMSAFLDRKRSPGFT